LSKIKTGKKRQNIMNTTLILQMIVRVIGLILLILGLIFWTGNAYSLILVHIWLGYLLTLALFVLIFQAFRAGVSIGLLIVSVVLGAALPLWGLYQGAVFPASFQWVGQVLHALSGIIAIGLAEMIGAQIRRKSSPPTAVSAP
jgi:hypothetical protein